jgi:hypothetical protein
MVTFGDYDVKRFAKTGLSDKDVFWGKAVQGESYWTLNLKDAALSGKPLNGLTSRYAIMDTGVSYALIPAADFILLTD